MNPLMIGNGYVTWIGLAIWGLGNLLHFAGLPMMSGIIEVGAGLAGLGATRKVAKQLRGL